ncbi:polyadenylate polymerase, putative, partial [Perkinsus marinus ATCC 50983]
VTRDAFFELFPLKLSELNDVTNLNPVPQAAVPVIKMKFMGVDVDVLYCGLAHPLSGPAIDPADDNLLCGMDEKSARSINGVRVSDAIKTCVPHFAHFLGALRVIRAWARRRGIYSNALGYLGGVSWAILVARVCQLFPNMGPSQLVVRFFRVYSRWNWDPSEGAVVLRHSEQRNGEGFQHHKVWCPPPKRTTTDQPLPLAASPMAVITPAYPSMNSTFGVTRMSMDTIKKELERGAGIISSKGVDLRSRECWETLLEPIHFFDYDQGGYKQFLQ